MGFTFHHSTSVLWSTHVHISLKLPSPTTTPSPTTSFTQPPECRVPVILETACLVQPECDAVYLPFVFLPFDSVGEFAHIQCLPETTTDQDGVSDAVYDYDQGSGCPGGMTTATTIETTTICCPTGLTYSYDEHWEGCTGTIREGTVFVGVREDNEATVLKTIGFSSTDSTTLHVTARPVRLRAEGSDLLPSTPDNIPPKTTSTVIGTPHPTETPRSSKTFTSSGTVCRRENGCEPTTTTTTTTTSAMGTPGTSGQWTTRNQDIIISAIIGGTSVLLLLALGVVFLIRRCRRKLSDRHRSLSPSATGTQTSGNEVEAAAAAAAGQAYRKGPLPPELPAAEVRAELEGTEVEGRGAGIYVWKPELEGTAGESGPGDVYVRRKAELESAALRCA